MKKLSFNDLLAIDMSQLSKALALKRANALLSYSFLNEEERTKLLTILDGYYKKLQLNQNEIDEINEIFFKYFQTHKNQLNPYY